MTLSRRTFLAGTATALMTGNRARGVEKKRPKIAALTTIYHKYSHSQHIVDRFLEGYGWEGRRHRPEMDVVSLYVGERYITARLVASFILGLFPGIFVEEFDDGSTCEQGASAVLARGDSGSESEWTFNFHVLSGTQGACGIVL